MALYYISYTNDIGGSVVSYYTCDVKVKQSTDINNILPYFQFLCLNPIYLNIKILCHNFLVVIVSYILNMFSFGLYGCITMAKSSFIIGYVIKFKEFLIVIFALLELLGVMISCCMSNYIFNIFSNGQFNTKKIFITTLVTGIILLFIYSVAGYIETQYIINTLNKGA